MAVGLENKKNSVSESADVITRKLYHFMCRWGLICHSTDNDILMLKGIKDSKKVFAGPQIVHIDLTNQCNMNCIACWCKSPLIAKSNQQVADGRKTLSFESIQRLSEDLSRLTGVAYIKISGGGEPLMHPRFLDAIQIIKNQLPNAVLDIHTNLSLVDKSIASQLINFGADKITVSLWAGTAEAYERTHPNQGCEAFSKIVETLTFIAGNRVNGKPWIEIHDVIMTLNKNDVSAMLQTAVDIGVDAITYTLVDAIPSTTEHLLLNRRERLDLLNYFKGLRKSIDRYNRYLDKRTNKSIAVCNYDALLKRLSQNDTEVGQYDKSSVDMMPCYMGWAFTRIMADGKVIPCCKGHRMPMGNINNKSFCDIWHGRSYNRFRSYALTKTKTHQYFRLMGNGLSDQTGCYNCDNVMDNLLIHRKILNYSGIYKQLHFELMRNIRMWIQSIT